ncbi:hypothetical protein PRCB_04425 [Pantoea rodasii]|uniref:Uncharacterized protein n=1 Tax=Pantoea rodasii TaxID=1076549 RepID=A0A2M9WEU1_9GAMM|nr:hypothetical protein [Pantoea rodasii]PJZ05978.1 hypothetical protein PRCB_04425 [Pantoea rodasii]
MNNIERQQLIDEILGEATLTLLQKAGPISFRALLEQLQSMKDISNNPERQELLALTIAEVRKSVIEGDATRQRTDKEIKSTQRLYTESTHSDRNSKH